MCSYVGSRNVITGNTSALFYSLQLLLNSARVFGSLAVTIIRYIQETFILPPIVAFMAVPVFNDKFVTLIFFNERSFGYPVLLPLGHRDVDFLVRMCHFRNPHIRGWRWDGVWLVSPARPGSFWRKCSALNTCCFFRSELPPLGIQSFFRNPYEIWQPCCRFSIRRHEYNEELHTMRLQWCHPETNPLPLAWQKNALYALGH